MLRLTTNSDQLQDIIPVIFIGMPIILFIIIFLVLRNTIWANSNKVLSELNISDFEVFDNISIQISRYSIFRLTTGIPHKAKMLINNSQIVILFREKPTFFDVNIDLPLTLYNTTQKDNSEIKILKWNEITIILKGDTKEFIKVRKELNIKPKDGNDFERLKIALINWC